jgi:molybdopterin synthase catalytic subunit
MMEITVLLFATLKDIAGQKRVLLMIPDEATTVGSVRRALVERFPSIADNLDAAISAVNQEYAFPDDAVKHGDEVAFFPPVSGGEGSYPELFRLAEQPFSTDELIAAITIPATGAVCVFSGMVRGETNHQGELAHTERLEYEAYEAMALEKMRQVAREIRGRWELVQGIAIVQRVGRLEVGQNTIVIACASGHRDQGCFEATRYGIDRLKEIVPVWKKEIRPDGSSWVEGHYVPTTNDNHNFAKFDDFISECHQFFSFDTTRGETVLILSDLCLYLSFEVDECPIALRLKQPPFVPGDEDSANKTERITGAQLRFDMTIHMDYKPPSLPLLVSKWCRLPCCQFLRHDFIFSQRSRLDTTPQTVDKDNSKPGTENFRTQVQDDTLGELIL